jgi:multimeric flavodoxin WrbA
MPNIRKEMPDVRLTRGQFAQRMRERFHDPAFAPLRQAVDSIIEVAWDAYEGSRKAPHTRPAGPGYADPTYELSIEWSETSRKLKEAERRQKDSASQARILLINGAARSEHTCPGESSKSWRLAMIARDVFIHEQELEIELLDLSRLTSEYGRAIHPCKTCVSTAMPLCHWPCSCYPNHALGQVQDWMNDIYPMWAAAHGIMIVTPVNWYQAPSVLKLMIDRLVCADGGNPDPTSTHGKNAERAKEMELAGWSYPRHLEGRVFSLIVHGGRRFIAAESVRLVERHGTDRSRSYVSGGQPYRIHGALCHGPCLARSGHRDAGGGTQCRAFPGPGGQAIATWRVETAGRGTA